MNQTQKPIANSVFSVANIAFLSVIGLQALSMIDGLTTVYGLSFSGAYETNVFYFGLLVAKTLALSFVSFLFLSFKVNQKARVFACAFALTLGVLWLTVIANNLGVILK